MHQVDWKKFILVAIMVLVAANLAGSFLGRAVNTAQAPSTPASVGSPELRVAAASQTSDGVTDADLSPQLAQALEKYGVGRISAKLEAMATQAGVQSSQPNIRSESTVINTEGKHLVIIRYEIDSRSKLVEIMGIAGPNTHRVMCARDNLEEILLTSGPCAEKIREVHGVKIGG